VTRIRDAEHPHDHCEPCNAFPLARGSFLPSARSSSAIRLCLASRVDRSPSSPRPDQAASTTFSRQAQRESSLMPWSRHTSRTKRSTRSPARTLSSFSCALPRAVRALLGQMSPVAGSSCPDPPMKPRHTAVRSRSSDLPTRIRSPSSTNPSSGNRDRLWYCSPTSVVGFPEGLEATE